MLRILLFRVSWICITYNSTNLCHLCPLIIFEKFYCFVHLAAKMLILFHWDNSHLVAVFFWLVQFSVMQPSGLWNMSPVPHFKFPLEIKLIFIYHVLQIILYIGHRCIFISHRIRCTRAGFLSILQFFSPSFYVVGIFVIKSVRFQLLSFLMSCIISFTNYCLDFFWKCFPVS